MQKFSIGFSMNSVFFIICITTISVMIFSHPEQILPTMLGGGEKALNLILTLLPSYALWLGFFALLEASGITEKLAKALKKPINALFGKTDEETNKLISINLSANLLGMSGIATPTGISACERLDKQNNVKALSTLFVLSASGLQLLPTSVISLRTEFLSANPTDIILPTLLSTLVSATVGIILVKILIRK